MNDHHFDYKQKFLKKTLMRRILFSFFFHWCNLVKKRIQNSKIKWFWRFSIVGSEKKKSSNFCIFCIVCRKKYIERWLKIFISYLVSSHIWLNLPMGDCHFFFITSSYGWWQIWLQKTILKNNTGAQQPFFHLKNFMNKWNNFIYFW
jgi:hypothetical protein